MTSLTRTAIITRKIIRYGVYSLVGIIILRGAILTGIKIYRHFFPVPPPAPTVIFGKLSKLPFPDKPKLEGVSYTLETPEGTLPTLPQQAKVYFMPRPSSQLLSLDSAKAKASRLGYSVEGAEVTETVYKFPNAKSPSQLQISIVSGVFSIIYDLVQDSSPLEKRPFPAEVAASKVRSYLSAADVLPKEISGPTKSQFVKLENQKIVGAISLSDANFIKVNFFRKSYDDLPSLTPDPDKAKIWFIASGESVKEKLIIAAEYHYFPVDESKSATYPLKTAQAAWDEFAGGRGYVASFGENKEGQNIKIRRVYLANYDAGVATDFFQPIVVFEGDKGFIAYVPAVTDDYYGN